MIARLPAAVPAGNVPLTLCRGGTDTRPALWVMSGMAPLPAAGSASSTSVIAANEDGQPEACRCMNIPVGRRPPGGVIVTAATAQSALDNCSPIRRYLKSVWGVSDVTNSGIRLRRRHCYLQRCLRRSPRGVTYVTCANPLLAAAFWPCLLTRGPRQRHVSTQNPLWPGLLRKGLQITAVRCACWSVDGRQPLGADQGILVFCLLAGSSGRCCTR